LIQPGKKVISVPFQDPLGLVWQVLQANEILSVPVVKGDVVAGFVDVLDICEYVVRLTNENTNWSEAEAKHLARKLNEAEAERLINLSGVNYYNSVTEDATVEDAIKKLATFRSHRLAVLNDKNQLLGIISQSDINQFALKHIDEISPGSLTVKSLGLVHGCIMMGDDTTLSDILRTLMIHKFSAVALVDESMKLKANFSASDLRGVTRRIFSKFFQSGYDFLKENGKGVVPKIPIVESPEITLKDCIRRLAEQKVHRMWLEDKHNHPIGVVSLTDIMPLLLDLYVEAPTSK
jgi:CBS domain-containing protein